MAGPIDDSMLIAQLDPDDPGPIDNSVLHDQEKHVSSAVWEGQERGPLRCHEHTSKLGEWRLTKKQIQLVDKAGFGYLRHMPSISLDNPLISALVERWRTETNTFHFTVGEMTVTLKDVALLLGLPIDGDPVLGVTYTSCKHVCDRFLGRLPDSSYVSGGMVKLSWLKDNFSTCSEGAPLEEVERKTRAYLLYLSGSTIFSTTTGNKVPVMYLPLFEDFDRAGNYAWGAAALAFLYRALGKASLKSQSTISGCLTMLQKIKFEEAIAAPEFERRSIADSIDYRSIGMSPSSSSVPTKAAVVAVITAVLAVITAVLAVVVMLGSSMATTVAGIVVATLMVLGAYWWGCCSGSNVLTKSPKLELEVEPQYDGARIEGDVITLDFVKKMMDDFKNEKCIHKRYAFQIVLQTRDILRALPSLVDINIPDGHHFTVCGDVHGQFYDLLNIFELNGLPSEDNPYLFNGDFVDRGSFSLEVILTLFAFKCMSPSAIYLARGNHESKSMNKIYGFEGEVLSKLSDKFVDLFSEVFCCLPLAHVLNGKVFVVHGGLFSVDGVKLSDIRAIDRFCEPPEEGLMCELLWSDPQPTPGRGPSERGVGLSFGADVTKRFLQDNNLDLVVRSHEVKDEGYEIEHDGKLITVFSAPNYCDQMGNKGAFIRFEAPEMEPNIVTFAAVAHPEMMPVAYANKFLDLFS